MASKADLMNEARRYVRLRTPWVHQGQNAHGLDCVGHVYTVLRATGCIDPAFKMPTYGRIPDGRLLNNSIAFNCDLVWERSEGEPHPKLHQIEECDIVLIAWKRVPLHCGWVGLDPSIVGRRTLIHTYAEVGFAVEHGIDEQWRRRITHVFRPRGLE